jgi:2-aminobenzoate-CoA ligase
VTYTSHVDTFARDHLPPRDQWPDLVFDLPELRYPERLNCAVELLDRAVERGWGERAAILTPPGLRWTYAELTAGPTGLRGCSSRTCILFPATASCCGDRTAR